MQVGDKVLRTGWSTTQGTITRLITARQPFGAQPTTPTHAAVDWPAPHRMGGRGFHRSTCKLTALVPATREEMARRTRTRAEEPCMPDPVAPLRAIVGTTHAPETPLVLGSGRYELLECGHTGRILRHHTVAAVGTRRRCQICAGRPGQHHAR